tara:strand:+ start:2297 stop:2443 length:147 start_codon:yes stop_codon:yes gene_type:complete
MNKEVKRLMILVDKLECENTDACSKMKIRDIVNTSYYRLQKVFNINEL